MLILGIESSCDETGVGLVHASTTEPPRLLAHALHSQIDLHEAYGGVVPELASRDHIRRVVPLARQVMKESGYGLKDISYLAVTQGPGLAGALLVGSGFAAGLSAALGKPMIGIHHLEGHLLSPFLSQDPPQFPFVALLVSGGHTQLMLVERVGSYELLGETVDDAAGEAFDKSAKLMGLGYPGGPLLSQLAQGGDAQRFAIPRPLMHDKTLDFSFAGLKTSVRTHVEKLQSAHEFTDEVRRDMAASVQAAIVEVLCRKSIDALKRTNTHRLVVAGGVGANRLLRDSLVQAAHRINAKVHFPELELCTDNGAMIALAAAMRYQAGLVKVDELAPAQRFSVQPRWPLYEANTATPR